MQLRKIISVEENKQSSSSEDCEKRQDTLNIVIDQTIEDIPFDYQVSSEDECEK